MCLAGSAIFRAEDEGGDGGSGEPEPFEFQRVESYLELSLEAPNGATDLLPGTTRPLVAAVNRIAWEIWQRPSTGESEIRNSSVTPEPGVAVSFAVTVGEGSLSMDSVTTGESGEGAIVFTAGWAPQSATVTATMAAGSTASLTFDPPGEAWAYHHSEATLTATLGSSSSLAEVPTGEARDLVATVSYVTWDVMESNYGNQRVENISTSPADGAQVTWSVASGDGYVTGAGTAGADGVSLGSLTMGSVDSVARVDVAYATGQATSAQLLFTVPPPAPDPAETWTLDRTEMEPVMTFLWAEGGPQQPAGTAVAVTGSAQIDRWDVWVNGLGQEDRRYNYSMPLPWRTVTFTVESGDGSLSSSSVSTDGTGSFSVTYYLGSAPSRLAVAVDADPDSTVDATGALDFTIASPTGDGGGGGDPGNGGDDGGGNPPPWSLLRTEGEYTISSLSVDGPTYDVEAGATRTISGTVSWTSWEVWTDAYGTTEIRNATTVPVDGQWVNFAIESGDGSLGATMGWSGNGIGSFSVPFTMGTQASRVRVWLSAGVTGAEPSASVELTPAPVPPAPEPEIWTKERNEMTLTVEWYSPQDAGVEIGAGTVVPFTVRVTRTSWEWWTSNRGNAEARQYETGPAIGADVAVTLHEGGDAETALSLAGETTNASGEIHGYLTMGRADATLLASAAFQATEATATRTFAAERWNLLGVDRDLIVDLSVDAEAAMIHADVICRTWEVWSKTANPAIRETRAFTTGPAVGATVEFGLYYEFVNETLNASTDGTGRASIWVGHRSDDGGLLSVEMDVEARFAGLIGLAFAGYDRDTGTIYWRPRPPLPPQPPLPPDDPDNPPPPPPPPPPPQNPNPPGNPPPPIFGNPSDVILEYATPMGHAGYDAFTSLGSVSFRHSVVAGNIPIANLDYAYDLANWAANMYLPSHRSPDWMAWESRSGKSVIASRQRNNPICIHPEMADGHSWEDDQGHHSHHHLGEGRCKITTITPDDLHHEDIYEAGPGHPAAISNTHYFRMRAAMPSWADRSFKRSFLIQRWSGSYENATIEVRELSFQIKKYRWFSDVVSIAATDPTIGGDPNGVGEIAIVPLEALVPNLDEDGAPTNTFSATNSLRIAKWERAYSSANLNLKSNFISLDADRFRIRLPKTGGPLNANLHLMLSTEADDGTIIDPPHQVSLVGDGAYLQTPDHLLVWQEKDDHSDGTDERNGDQTSIVYLPIRPGEELPRRADWLVVTLLNSPGKFRFPIRHEPVADLLVYQLDFPLKKDQVFIRERSAYLYAAFSQCGIEIKPVHSYNVPIPTGTAEPNGGFFATDPKQAGQDPYRLSDEHRRLQGHFGQQARNSGYPGRYFHQYYVGNVSGGGVGYAVGMAFSKNWLLASSDFFGDSPYLEASFVTIAAHRSTPAHELLHILANSDHPGTPNDHSGPNVIGNLLQGPSDRDGRINHTQQETILFEVRAEAQPHPLPLP